MLTTNSMLLVAGACLCVAVRELLLAVLFQLLLPACLFHAI
jgi:hypothetical protein